MTTLPINTQLSMTRRHLTPKTSETMPSLVLWPPRETLVAQLVQSEYSHLAQPGSSHSHQQLSARKTCAVPGVALEKEATAMTHMCWEGEVSAVSDKRFTGCCVACDSDRNAKQPVLSVDSWASQSPGQKQPQWRLLPLSCSPEMFWCSSPVP